MYCIICMFDKNTKLKGTGKVKEREKLFLSFEDILFKKIINIYP